MNGKKLFEALDLLGAGNQADVLRGQVIDHLFRCGDLSGHVPMRYRRTDEREFFIVYSSKIPYTIGRGYEEDNGWRTSSLHSFYALAVLESKKKRRLLTVDNQGDFSIDFPEGLDFSKDSFYTVRK